ncbi:MAG: ABC transporter permease [Paracoccaceae bacterium]
MSDATSTMATRGPRARGQVPGTALPRRTGSRARSITALMLREMQASYGSRPGGYLWALLEPMGMILILTFAFSLILRTPSLGNSFILFYASGYLVFALYGRVASTSTGALEYSRNLMAYPVVLWVDAIAARIALNATTNVVVGIIVTATIMISIEANTVFDPGPILESIAAAICLGAGLGMVNAIATNFFPVYGMVWNILTRPLLLASGVLYIYEDLPTTAQNILWWNPLIHITGRMREGFYVMYEPQHISMTYVWGIALTLLALGTMLVRRFHGNVMKR